MKEYNRCASCEEIAYTKTHTGEGVREIQISRMCKECSDRIYIKEPQEKQLRIDCVEDLIENGFEEQTANEAFVALKPMFDAVREEEKDKCKTILNSGRKMFEMGKSDEKEQVLWIVNQELAIHTQLAKEWTGITPNDSIKQGINPHQEKVEVLQVILNNLNNND